MNSAAIHVSETPTLILVSILDHSVPERGDNCLLAGGNTEFLLSAFEICIRGFLADRKNLADLPFGFAGGVPLQTFPFTRRQ